MILDVMRWGAAWDPEADKKLRKSFPNLTEGEMDIKYYMNDYITGIYNKLSAAAAKNELHNLTELMIFRLLSQMKEIVGGSLSQVSHAMGFKKNKKMTEMARESMANKLCCLICEQTRVQYGWWDNTNKKVVMKFCGKCYNHNKQACIENCEKDKTMIAAQIKFEVDESLKEDKKLEAKIRILRKHFRLVSFAGKTLTIKMGMEVKKQNIITVPQTPLRDPDYDFNIVSEYDDPEVIEIDPITEIPQDPAKIPSVNKKIWSKNQKTNEYEKKKAGRPKKKESQSESEKDRSQNPFVL